MGTRCPRRTQEYYWNVLVVRNEEFQPKDCRCVTAHLHHSGCTNTYVWSGIRTQYWESNWSCRNNPFHRVDWHFPCVDIRHANQYHWIDWSCPHHEYRDLRNDQEYGYSFPPVLCLGFGLDLWLHHDHRLLWSYEICAIRHPVRNNMRVALTLHSLSCYAIAHVNLFPQLHGRYFCIVDCLYLYFECRWKPIWTGRNVAILGSW